VWKGLARLHVMVADHAEDLSDVVVGIETDRGLLVGALGLRAPASTR
jgi:hypothetical protein